MKPTTLDEAMALTKKFTERPSNEELLKLYGLYKQATDFKAAAKYNSWLSLKGKSQEEATQEYIDFVGNLSEKYI